MSSLGGVGDGDMLIKNRFLGFLIWQSVQSTAIFLLCKSLLLSHFTQNPLSPSFSGFLAFLLFNLSLLLFSASVFAVASPQPHRSASLSELALGLVRFIFVSGGQSPSSDFRRRATVSLGFLLFLTSSAWSGFLSVVCVCWNCDAFAGLPTRYLLETLGFRGLVVGFFYGLHYIFKRRWVLEFPIIQRPPFFSFKMGIPSAIGKALKLSTVGYLFSAVLTVFLPNESTGRVTMGKFLAEQIIFFVGSFIVFLCWELSHHLHQVLNTKRFIFAPPKGSAAAETNPSEPLLATLEGSPPRSLLQYLAYLDLCMVCERNVDTWRRAAFFEETGDTYKRVIAVCLKPLEQLALKLGEGLDGSSVEKSLQLSHQLQSPTNSQLYSRFYEPFNDLQLCAWCARASSSLTAHSHKEDRFGVAQLSGSNAAVISTLLSCLLAVETFMGKKINLQSPNLVTGPAFMKFATVSTGRSDVGFGGTGKRIRNPQYSKAYCMADILRTNIYCIVSTFHDEMVSAAKAGLLEKDWIMSSKPPYGTHGILLQKLKLFLDFNAS